MKLEYAVRNLIQNTFRVSWDACSKYSIIVQLVYYTVKNCINDIVNDKVWLCMSESRIQSMFKQVISKNINDSKITNKQKKFLIKELSK